MLSVLGIVCAIVFLSVAIYKGLNPAIAAFVGTLMIVVTGASGVTRGWNDAMGMAGGVFTMMGPLFILGGIMGLLYARSGAIKSLADFLMAPVDKINEGRGRYFAVIWVIILVRFLLGLAGISAGADIPTMTAMGVVAFRKANMPSKYIPALIMIASSIGNLIPGTPTIVNMMLEKFIPDFTTGSMMVLRLVMMLLWLLLSSMLLTYKVDKDVKAGYRYTEVEFRVPEEFGPRKPHWILSLIPLFAVFGTYNYFHLQGWQALMIGALLSAVMFGPFMVAEEGKTKFGTVISTMNTGTLALPLAFMMIMVPAMAMATSSGMQIITDFLGASGMPVTLIMIILCLIMMGFAGPSGAAVVGTLYLSIGAPAGMSGLGIALIAIWSSQVFDSLPNNPSVPLCASMMGLSVKEIYPSIFQTTVILTFVMTVAAAIIAGLGLV